MTYYGPRGLSRVIAPAAEPLTLNETKQFLRIDHDDDDARIHDMILTARALAESWLKRSLVTQSWKITHEEAISGSLRLPMGPVQAITSIVTTTREGEAVTIDDSAYALSASRDALMVENIIQGYRIDITYSAGYGASSQVPKPIKLGLLQHVASMWDGQLCLAPIPDAVLSLYLPFREMSL